MKFMNGMWLIASSFLVGCLVAGCQFSYENTTETSDSKTGDGESLVETAFREVSEGNAVLVDVRRTQEWDGGHYALAKNMPIDDLESLIKASDISKDTKIYTHCAKGVRAARAAATLNEIGYDATPLKEPFSKIGEGGFKLAE